MKVFITGGSGFVGRAIIHQLLISGHSVRALIRQPAALFHFSNVETVVGDTTQPETLEKQLSGCHAVIHLVGIIREFPGRGITFDQLHIASTHNVLRAAAEQGINRYLQMSANGSREDGLTDYHRTKWEAEKLVRQSKLDWTIFRPSLIFGQHDQFVNMLAQLIRKLPLVPVMGDGQYQLQPVSISDIAKSFAIALNKPETIGRSYSCCGPQTFSYNQILDLIAQALGKSAGSRKIHQPLWLMKPLVAALQSIPQFPITSDQLQMLLEGNVCTNNSWQNDFSLELHEFSSTIRAYLK
jgi:NADH dehydrogenase